VGGGGGVAERQEEAVPEEAGRREEGPREGALREVDAVAAEEGTAKAWLQLHTEISFRDSPHFFQNGIFGSTLLSSASTSQGPHAQLRGGSHVQVAKPTHVSLMSGCRYYRATPTKFPPQWRVHPLAVASLLLDVVFVSCFCKWWRHGAATLALLLTNLRRDGGCIQGH
jgi:hypothetical protein